MPIALPSLGAVITDAQRTVRRFPLAVAAAALAAFASVLAIEEVGPEWAQLRLILAASLGIPLFTAATLLAERQQRRALAQLGLGAAGVLLLVLFFAAWPHWSEPVQFGRYVQVSVAFHLLVVFAPVSRGRLNAFWQFNRALLERLVVAAAFTGTLFLGLALALVALDKLFGVEVQPTAYARIWAMIAFVFNTWFFLAGVPEHPDALEDRRDYPAVLRVFSQYALVPLVSVYLVILTLYLGKVVVTWAWPSGWIGFLVSGVAAAGIFALLLAHPMAEDPEQRWVATFARQFWIAIIPSIVMLWFALYQRVHQYGITERRYFLILLSLWLAAAAVYYAITRSRNIRLIPVSLCVVALVTLTGPWGAYAMSERSQVGRLRGTLVRSGMFANGAVRRPAREVSAADRSEISAIVRYLLETHGTGAIAPWFPDTATAHMVRAAGKQARLDPGTSGRWAEVVVSRLGIEYVNAFVARTGVRSSWYGSAETPVLAVRGFDYVVQIRASAGRVPDSGYQAVLARRPLAVRILRARDTLLVVPLDSMLARIQQQGGRGGRSSMNPDLFVTEAESRAVRARILVTTIEVRDSVGTPRVAQLVGRALIAAKR